MLLDATVERRKFTAEVKRLERNAARLRSLGAFVVRVEAPEIDIIFVPRLPLRVIVQVAATPAGPAIQLEFPNISARGFGVRLDLSGYDQRPPSVSFRDPWTWAVAAYATLPIGYLVDGEKQPQPVILPAHPATKQPFLCLRGVREYHDHPQHDGDNWARYRSGMNPFAVVTRIARVALASSRPLVALPVQALWTPELLWQFLASSNVRTPR